MAEQHRRSIRLPGFDYASTGAYFVTICSYRRELLFEDEDLKSILEEEWRRLPSRFPSVHLDVFVTMPNHVHFVVWLHNDAVGAPLAGAPLGSSAQHSKAGASPAPTLSAVVGAYKSLVAVSWLRWLKTNAPHRSGKVWQRNYHDRIIRSDMELNRIREYIAFNPVAWQYDSENLSRDVNADYERAWSWLERSD